MYYNECCRFKLTDDDVTKTSAMLASDDVTDDASALAADESSLSTVRKSSHHGYSISFIIIVKK